MNTESSPSSIERPVRCWCGTAPLEDFSPDYYRCPECQTLVLRAMRGEEISRVRDDEQDFYGKNYYLHHVQEDYGLPDLETRARADLPERCLHWLRTLLKYVSGPGARTLELGCGHGGFVAMQRWAGLDATGLELSPWLVRRARDWFGVPVLEGRLEDQALVPGSLDAVAMMDVLEHLPDPRRTLGLAVSLLRSPQSFLLIQTPCYPVGLSYEELVARDHPFLQQLKPMEHLYLFSEQAVRRLCVELGLGEVRFEPAIFAHYDLFAVASAAPLSERAVAQRAELLMAATPPARWTLALLDLGEVRDDLHTRLATLSAETESLRATAGELWPKVEAAENARNLLAAQLDDMRGRFESVEADNAARLAVIERQGAEITRLHSEVDYWLSRAGELGPKLEAAENARNLLAAQLDDMRGRFESVEADNAARLAVIERQGAEITRLHSEVDHWLGRAGELGPRVDAAENARNLVAAQLADLRGQFESVEADNAERLAVIERQGAEVARLHAEVDRQLKEAGEFWPRLDAAVNEGNLRVAQTADAAANERNLLTAQLRDLRAQFELGEADRASRLQVIESQGAEITRLHAEVDRWLGRAGELGPRVDAAENARNLLAAQMADLRGHFERSEADRAARLTVIENQGTLLGALQTQAAAVEVERERWNSEADALRATHNALQTQFKAVESECQRLSAEAGEMNAAHSALRTQATATEGERARLATEVGDLRAENAALAAELAAERRCRATLEAHWTGRLLKKTGLGPL